MTTRSDFDAAIAALNLVHFPTGSGQFPAPGYPGLGDMIKDALVNAPSEGLTPFDLPSGAPDSSVIIGEKDNATCMRCRGPQSPEEGSAVVQSYMGIFYDTNYDANFGIKTRFIVGANAEMDLELQSPNALKISAAETDGIVVIGSNTSVVFNLRDTPDRNSAKMLVLDRVDVSSSGTGNVSDVNIKCADGSLYLNAGVTLGAVVLPTLDTTQRNALTPVTGMIIFNSTTTKAEVYDGSTWQACW